MNGRRAVLLWECADPQEETALEYLAGFEKRWGSRNILVGRKPSNYGDVVRIYRIET